MPGHVELRYRRPVDGASIVLLADLPAVRALEVGGAPDGLRLPWTPPDVTYLRLTPSGDSFVLEPLFDELLLNGAPAGRDPVTLGDGDAIRIPPFELIFHDGEIRDDERVLDSAQRWKQRVPDEIRAEGEDEIRDDSAPYIREFELSVKPLIAADEHDEVERRAAAEILRLIRADEAEHLERYCRSLWSIRVAATARAGKAQQAEELCQHAIDLFPHDASLQAWLGSSQLRRHAWRQAEATLSRCLRIATHADLRAMHMARIGLILARDQALALEQPALGHLRPIDPHGGDWNVPRLELHAPGDELLYWNLLRGTRLFGSETAPQFRYRGQDPESRDRTRIVQRWEIFDRAAARVYRRLLILPAAAYADPSLMVEGSLLRQYLAQHDPAWMQGVIDLSDAENPARRSPIVFEQSVIDVLARAVTSAQPIVRVATARRGDDTFTFHVSFVATPQTDDVVYAQGSLRVAVAESDVELLAGARLSWLVDADGEGFCLESPNFTRVRILKKRRPAAKPRRISPRAWRGIIIGLILLLSSLLLRLLVRL